VTGTHWTELIMPIAGRICREAFDVSTKAENVIFYKLKDLKFRSILHQEVLEKKQ